MLQVCYSLNGAFSSREKDRPRLSRLFSLDLCPGAQSFLLEGEPEASRGQARKRQGDGRTFLRLARVAIDRRFHGLELLVPDVRPTARTNKLCFPQLLVE